MFTRFVFVFLLCVGSVLRAADALVLNRSLRGAQVVRVLSGDKVVITIAGQPQITVHLHGIAAPAVDQPFGMQAKEELTKLCLEKSAEVFVQQVISQSEIYGIVFATTTATAMTNANIEMVRRGCAWYDVGSGVVKKKDLEKPYRNSNLVDFEAEAKRARRGLWAEKNPVPPWEWRKKKPNKTPEPTPTAVTPRAKE